MKKWSCKRLNDLPKIMQPISGEFQVWAQESLAAWLHVFPALLREIWHGVQMERSSYLYYRKAEGVPVGRLQMLPKAGWRSWKSSLQGLESCSVSKVSQHLSWHLGMWRGKGLCDGRWSEVKWKPIIHSFNQPKLTKYLLCAKYWRG